MPSNRYDAVAVVLHWAIAAAILANLACGWWMGGALEDPALKSRAIAAFQLHKSLGLTVLALSLLRLAWRLGHRPPPLPQTMPGWEVRFARAGHWVLYAAMVALPLTGWLYVSAQWRHDAPLAVPTLWFGLFEVPHLFGLDQAEPALRKAFSARAFAVHKLLAIAMAAMLAAHVAAALKHQFVDRDGLMGRMKPGLGAALALALLAAGAAAGIAHMDASQVEAAAPAEADGGWVLDPASSIEFSGNHVGVDFRGRFARWSADIRFDPARPEAARIKARFEMASASDGLPLHDEMLPQAEWFDVANHPIATYEATRVVPTADGAFDVEGTLTLKGRKLPVRALELRRSAGAIEVTGNVTIDRAEADLGMESDPQFEYVSRRIRVDVRVRATPP